MCTKYILDPCEEAIPIYCKVREEEHRLVISRHHDKYRGDATWSINTLTDADGDKSIRVVVTDNHNIEKAILYIQHIDPGNYVPTITIKVRDLLSNPIIPDSLVRSRLKGMVKHGFLTSDGRDTITSKGYELFMMLRGGSYLHSYLRGVPTKLREAIKSLGSDLVRSCDT